MQTDKKIFAIYDAGGDCSKNWFVYWQGPDGKRVRKYGTINQAKTKEGRGAAAAALVAELERNYKAPPSNAAQIQELYKALNNKERTLRKKTFQSYKTKLNGLTIWLKGKQINAANLRRYFDHCANVQAPGTAHDTFFTIRRVLGYCGLDHLAKGWKPPTPTPEPLRIFQKHETERLRDWMQTHDATLLLWCQFVYYCFLRPRSELRLLKVGDILFEERKIRVPGRVSKNKKTSYVTIPNAFYPQIEHLKECPPARYIFEGKDCKPIGYNTLGVRFNKALEALGFEMGEYGVYSYKHTGAARYYLATKDIVGLQTQLRHHSLDQVQAYLRQLNVWDFKDIQEGFPAF